MFSHASTSPTQVGSPSGVPPGATLAEHHARYLQDRGVDPQRALGAFWTARKPSEVPGALSERQRRATPALIAAFHSPDGRTISYQMRPDYPRKNRQGKVVKWMSPPKENARMVLGAMPEMLDEVRHGSGPLWSVEGITRAAALAPFGVPAVGFCGCYGWQLPDWQHVNLKGRQVLAAFDGDYRTNSNVYEGLRRHVAFLEDQGARVLVVDVPEIHDDPHTGLDDFLAAGGHPALLARAARPFVPLDVTHERLSKDEKLRGEIEALWADWEAMPTITRGDCTERATVREILKIAEKRGKASEKGIKVRAAVRTLAPAVGISVRGQAKVMKRLEEKGRIRKAPGRREKDEAQTYVLTGGRALSSHKGTEGWVGKESQAQENKQDYLTYGESYTRVNSARGGDEGVPELRETKVVHAWEYAESRDGSGGHWRVVDSDVVTRLGKRRGEILRHLVRAGDPVPLSELVDRFGTEAQKQRPRDFRRRVLSELEGHRVKKGQKVDPGPRVRVRDVEGRQKSARDGFQIQTRESERVDLGPPIIEVNDGVVRLTPNWRENLESRRTLGREQEDEKLQAEKIARERESFRNPEKAGPKAKPTPEMPAREEVRRILREAKERDDAVLAKEEHDRVGTTAEAFVRNALAGLGKIRMDLLEEIWRDEGGRPRQIAPAVESMGCRVVLTLERDGRSYSFVYPPEPPPEPEPEPDPVPEPELEPPIATVTPINTSVPTVPSTPAPSTSNEHSLSCDCLDCSARAPRYARPWRGSR